MSVYQINKILYLTDNDAAFRKRIGVNRDNYLSRIREGMEYDPRFEQGKMPMQYFIKE